MLYIIPIDDYTIKFHDGNGHEQVYGIDLEARVDSVGRIWISDKYLERNVLNSYKVSDISLWSVSEYLVYDNAEDFVSAFNAIVAASYVSNILTESGFNFLTENDSFILKEA
jgi:hypothetical protein